MATAQPRTPNAVEVRVVVAGRYNGADHKSLGDQEVGAIIPVAAGWYADELIHLGLVELFVPEPVVEDAPVQDGGEADSKPARKRKGA